jgi:hypothetical protein
MKRIVPGYFALLVAGAVLTVTAVGGAFAAGPYDGNYHGTLTVTGFSGNACAKKAPIQMTVTDDKLVYVHLGNATITVTVAADGSFSGSGENKYVMGRSGTERGQTLQGKITGATIQATTDVGNGCHYQLSLTKYR